MPTSNPFFTLNLSRLPKENIALGEGEFTETSIDGEVVTYTRLNASNIPLTAGLKATLPGSPDYIGQALTNINNGGSDNLKKSNNLLDVNNPVTALSNLNGQPHTANLDAWSAQSVPAGGPVGVSATQTLQNKTLDTPTLNTPAVTNFTSAQHNHSSAAQGGQLSLTSAVTGTLPVTNGGTGLTTPGANGNVLTSNGSEWYTSAPSSTVTAPLNLALGNATTPTYSFTSNGTTGMYSSGTNQIDLTAGGVQRLHATADVTELVGRNNAAAVTPGMIGEVLSSYRNAGVNCAASGSIGLVTSLYIKKGTWLVSANLIAFGNSATFPTQMGSMFISTTQASSAGYTPSKDDSYFVITAGTNSAAYHGYGIIMPFLLSLASDTTYHLNASMSYTAGNPQWDRWALVAVRIA